MLKLHLMDSLYIIIIIILIIIIKHIYRAHFRGMPQMRCYTSTFATNTVKNRTDGAYALVYALHHRQPSDVWYSIAVFKDTVDSKSPSAVDISFQLHSSAYKKWITWAKPRPF